MKGCGWDSKVGQSKNTFNNYSWDTSPVHSPHPHTHRATDLHCTAAKGEGERQEGSERERHGEGGVREEEEYEIGGGVRDVKDIEYIVGAMLTRPGWVHHDETRRQYGSSVRGQGSVFSPWVLLHATASWV